MKEIIGIQVRYNQENDKTIYSILSGLSNDVREKERGSYYGSVSALFRHVLGGTSYFLGLFKASLPHNAAALKAIAPLEGLAIPDGALSEAQWKSLDAARETVDAALVNLVSALSDSDLKAPVHIEWYQGKPASVPLYFMLQQLHVHNTHHRGQISQILDELKVNNDYSAINVALLP